MLRGTIKQRKQEERLLAKPQSHLVFLNNRQEKVSEEGPNK